MLRGSATPRKEETVTPDASMPDAATWWSALLAVAFISLLSLVGAMTLVVRRERLARILPYLVSVAVGALLGTVFFDLLPDLAGAGFTQGTGVQVLIGIFAFFGFERFLHSHDHGHAAHARVAPYAWLNLVGDGLHNFADGIILAVAWMASPALGLSMTVAVALHEIPQELGDIGILVHGGMKPRTAVLLNSLTALVALLGAVVGLLLGARIAGFSDVVLGVTAGGFIYIAAADLMPELHRERRPLAALLQAACVVGGAAVMALAAHAEG